jgi:hypothetical protein
MPWSPPMMLVTMVGQASFQTALGMGPSTMERSRARRERGAPCTAVRGGAPGAALAPTAVASVAAAISALGAPVGLAVAAAGTSPSGPTPRFSPDPSVALRSVIS